MFGSDGRLRLSQSRVRAHVAARSAEALAERPHIETVIGCAGRCTATTRLWRALRARRHGDRQPRAGHGPARTARRQRRRLQHGAAAGRRHAGRRSTTSPTTVNVERALRERNEALEDADADQDRFRPSRLLRAALAAHQHHRLRSAAGRAGDRPLTDKQREYLGYISASTNALLAHHQQHPRPRHHRRRRDEARSRAGRHPRAP